MGGNQVPEGVDLNDLYKDLVASEEPDWTDLRLEDGNVDLEDYEELLNEYAGPKA